MTNPIPARLAPFLMSLVLGACATPTTKQDALSNDLTFDEIKSQQALHVEQVIRYQSRLEQISAPLLKAALPLCEDQETGYLGMRVDNMDAWTKQYHWVAKNVLKLDRALSVSQVTPDSPAARAGLAAGDVLMSINGKTVVGGPGATQDYNRLINKAMTDNKNKVTFVILRNGETISIDILPEQICDFPVYVQMNNAINAFANGRDIIVTSGLIRFAETDEELALVLAHEMGHNSMKHIEAKINNAKTGSLFDIVAAASGVPTGGLFSKIGARSFSKSFEQEADYTGLYIMARAGLALDNLDTFWRRMAAEDPASNKDSIFRTHPISAKRTLAIQQTIREIENKKNVGQPLLPNVKESLTGVFDDA